MNKKSLPLLLVVGALFVYATAFGGSSGRVIEGLSATDASTDADGGSPSDAGTAYEALSGPLFPNAIVFQNWQCNCAPDGGDCQGVYSDGGSGPCQAWPPANEAQVVQSNVDDFASLLQYCDDIGLDGGARAYPGIVLQSEVDGGLGAAQLQTNYDQVAACSYEQLGDKPYWVPQMVLDSFPDGGDLCAFTMGDPSWRVPTDEDVRGMSTAQLQYIQQTLASAAGDGGSSFAGMYFNLAIFVRMASDAGIGPLGIADLSGTTANIGPLPSACSNLGYLCTGANDTQLTVRCFNPSVSP